MKKTTNEVKRRHQNLEIGLDRCASIAQNAHRGAIQNEIRNDSFRHHEKKSDEGHRSRRNACSLL